MSHLQNQTTNMTVIKPSKAHALADQNPKAPNPHHKKVTGLLQKTQMVERRLQNTSQPNFILEDCNSNEDQNGHLFDNLKQS